MRQCKAVIVLALCLASLAFGGFKQVRTAVRSLESLRTPAADAGQAYAFLRPYLEGKDGLLEYVSDHPRPDDARPPAEYRYDLQYALAPFVMAAAWEKTALAVLDFAGEETLKEYCSLHGIRPVVWQGGIGLGLREAPAR